VPTILRCLTAVLLATPGLLAAQQPPAGPVQQPRLQSFEKGQWVRVVGAFERREGPIVEQSTHELTLAADPQPLRIPTTSIDTLWTRSRGTWPGVLVGGLIGLGLGALVAGRAGELEDTPPEFVWAVSLGGGAVLGGALGAAIGSTVPVWKRRYP
jgi:hypothetical protein